MLCSDSCLFQSFRWCNSFQIDGRTDWLLVVLTYFWCIGVFATFWISSSKHQNIIEWCNMIWHFNPLAVELFYILRWARRFLQVFTWHGLFQCLLFGMDFFLWYSCFPGWDLKLRPIHSTGFVIYTFFKAEPVDSNPLICTKPSKDKHKFFSFKGW